MQRFPRNKITLAFQTYWIAILEKTEMKNLDFKISQFIYALCLGLHK